MEAQPPGGRSSHVANAPRDRDGPYRRGPDRTAIYTSAATTRRCSPGSRPSSRRPGPLRSRSRPAAWTGNRSPRRNDCSRGRASWAAIPSCRPFLRGVPAALRPGGDALHREPRLRRARVRPSVRLRAAGRGMVAGRDARRDVRERAAVRLGAAAVIVEYRRRDPAHAGRPPRSACCKAAFALDTLRGLLRVADLGDSAYAEVVDAEGRLIVAPTPPRSSSFPSANAIRAERQSRRLRSCRARRGTRCWSPSRRTRTLARAVPATDRRGVCVGASARGVRSGPALWGSW